MPTLGDQLAELKQTVEACEEILPVLEKVIPAFCESLEHGKKVLSCGNGGSASDAMHLAEELVGRYRSNRKALPAVALTADGTALSCIANDWEWEQVFARQVEALGNDGDWLVTFSTSGNSESVLRAIRVAKEKGMVVLNLLGKGGGKAKGMGTYDIVIPSKNTARIQELHTWVLHALLEGVEEQYVVEV